jgi:hypothetical protein
LGVSLFFITFFTLSFPSFLYSFLFPFLPNFCLYCVGFIFATSALLSVCFSFVL